MPTSPLPSVCPDCGAALTQRAEFCPHCRISIESSALDNLILLLGALISGATSGLFALISLVQFDPAPHNELNDLGWGLLVITVPLALAGFWGARYLWREVLKHARE